MKKTTSLYLSFLCSFMLLGLVAEAQTPISQNLFVHKRLKNTNTSYERIHLSDEAANQFNITRFLAQHIEEYDIRITGNRITELETQKFDFDSKTIGDRTCPQFCSQKESGATAFLGVSVKHNEGEDVGVRVVAVTEGSAADRINLPVGAIIYVIEDLVVHSPCDFGAIVAEFYPGDKIKINYEIDDTEIVAEAILGARLNSTVTWVPCCETPLPEVAKNTDLGTESLFIAPNPNTGYFQLSFELEEEEPVIIRMTDNSGRVVYKETITAFNGFYNNHLDLSSAAAGLYYLNVIQKHKVISKKVVVQKE